MAIPEMIQLKNIVDKKSAEERARRELEKLKQENLKRQDQMNIFKALEDQKRKDQEQKINIFNAIKLEDRLKREDKLKILTGLSDIRKSEADRKKIDIEALSQARESLYGKFGSELETAKKPKEKKQEKSGGLTDTLKGQGKQILEAIRDFITSDKPLPPPSEIAPEPTQSMVGFDPSLITPPNQTQHAPAPNQSFAGLDLSLIPAGSPQENKLLESFRKFFPNIKKRADLEDAIKEARKGTYGKYGRRLNIDPQGLRTGSQKQSDAVTRQQEILKGLQQATPEQIEAQGAGLPAPTAQPGQAIQPPAGSIPDVPSLGPKSPALPKAPQIGRKVVVPEPPTMALSDVKSAFKREQEAIQEGIKQREVLRQQAEAVNRGFKTSIREYKDKMIRNMALQRELADNPPSFKKAVMNIGIGQVVIGILDAFMHGHLHQPGEQLLDQLIERELADQMNAYKAKGDFLKNQQSIYGQFYNLSKDELEAEASTRAVLYKNIADEIAGYSQMAQSQQELAKLEAMNKQVLFNHQQQLRSIDENAKQKAFERGIKLSELEIKKQKLALEKFKITDLGGLSKKERIDRRVSFGGRDYYDIPKPELSKKEGVRDVIRTSKLAVTGSYNLENVAKSITKISALKSMAADIPWVDWGEKDLAKFKTLNKGLIKLMLKSRIEFTGGGNMSEQEQRFLRQFYEVKEGRWFLKNTQATLKILMGLGRGDYDTLFKIVRKDAFYNTLKQMEQSPEFNAMTEQKKYAEVIKGLGIKTKDIKFMFSDIL